jgi:DNA helicase-2/ATP-dependent DNA helicase PcrA
MQQPTTHEAGPAVDSPLLAGLNPAQRQAVETVDGPVLVIAGAGSGKTRVLTHRLAHLVGHHGVPADRIMAITFTNKAAGEMAARVEGLIGARHAERAWVTTFHKTGVRILRREAAALDLRSGFTIYDGQDAQRLIARLAKDAGIDEKRLPPRAIAGAISRAKDELLSAAAFRERATGWPEDAIAEVYLAYESALRRSHALDLDDLIVRTVELFRAHPDVLARYQQRFTHLMIDEYQDTNRAQYHLVQLLAATNRNLMVVGDPDQGVYSFRGATIRNILDFEADYPDATVIPLTRNYRSTATILAAANAIIANNRARQPKELWTEAEDGPRVVRYHAGDEQDEAAFVVRQVEDHVRRGGGLDDVAVFYRTNAQSRVLEDALMRTAVPYRVVGGVRFYERREVRDILAYLQLVANPDDDVALRRVVNTPRRGLGDRSVEAIETYARVNGLSLMDACRDAERIVGLGARAVGAVTSFVSLLDVLRTELVHGLRVADLVEQVWERTGYLRELQAEGTIEALGREENVRELRSVAQGVAEASPDAAEAGEEGLRAFLDAVTLVNDQDQVTDGEGAVTLMTLHTAKGLEFPLVILTGMEDGVFPHVRSLGADDELEEERRLCYVGMTRAEERLVLTHADRRTLWGGVAYNPPSRFLDELPEELVERRGTPSVATTITTRTSSAAAAPAWGHGRGSSERLDDQHDGFRAGDTVLHPRFGRGRVTAVSPAGDDQEVSVNFEEIGMKHLMLAYAALVKE